MLTLGVAALAALGTGLLASQVVPGIAEAFIDARYGNDRRQAALVAGDLGVRMKAEDWKLLEVPIGLEKKRELIVNDAEFTYLQSIGPNDWLRPEVIRLVGEIISQQDSRRWRIERELR
jgi:hypothetical protein